LISILVGDAAQGGPPPTVGGAPVLTATEALTGTSLQMTVHAYVFRGVGTPVPPSFAPLSAHETLFVYYCMNSGTADIAGFALNNPNGLPVHAFGSSAVLPSGADASDRRDPDTIQAGPGIIQFTWSDNPGIGLQRLHADEWAVVFIRVFGMFGDVDAAAFTAGFADFGAGFLPGPVAAPALIIGDLNCDNVVDYLDVPAFVLAITDLPAYYAAYPACDAERADVNGDDLSNGLDVQGFVALLIGP